VAFRDSPFQALKAPLTWAAAAVAVVVALVALALLLTDHSTAHNAGPYGAARGEFDEVMEPITNVLSAPARWVTGAGEYGGGYFFAVSENRALKKQLAEMQRWRDAAIALKNLNLRYESLLKLRTEPPIPMVSARVVSDSRGPFGNARLADAGAAAGVKIGNPAMSEDGVVGRIVGVTKDASRILLLTDVQSRTPVLIDRTNARAILTGDGGPNPKLEFVRGLNSVQDGDMVLTSGDGGLYPRGLPVGVAAKDYRGVWRVRLYSDRAAIDFVRILVFDDFSRMVSQAELAQTALPALTPEEQAQLQAAKTAAAKPAPIPAVGPGGGAAKPATAAPPQAGPIPGGASGRVGGTNGEHGALSAAAGAKAVPDKAAAKKAEAGKASAVKDPAKAKIPKGGANPSGNVAAPSEDGASPGTAR
jgi:rod shape-determining protein MreC